MDAAETALNKKQKAYDRGDQKRTVKKAKKEFHDLWGG